MKPTVKRIWAHDFHEAYEKSLKVKFKFDKHATATDRKITDVKATQLNRQAGFLFDWLIKGKYAIPNHYKVGFACGICGDSFGIKGWSGSSLKGALVCNKCDALVERIRRTGKARPSKRLTALLKMDAIKFKKKETKA